MSPEHFRGGIAWFLLTLLAVVAVNGGDGKEIALTLTPIAALLARVIAYYFPRQPPARRR